MEQVRKTPRTRNQETTRQQKVDIHIKSKSPLELIEAVTYANDNHEDFTLIWYGHVRDEPRFETVLVPQLRDVINYFKRYRTIENCVRFISSITIEKVFVILANLSRHELQKSIKNLRDLEQVTYIYIYSEPGHDTDYPDWLEFQKVQGMFTNETELLLQLIEDVKSVNILSFDILNIDGDESSIRDLTKETVKFLKSKLLIDHLLFLPASDRGKRDVVLEFKNEYQGNPEQLKEIGRFAKTYKSEDAITWYTSGNCIHKITNKALRLQDMAMIFRLRFFITDLYQKLHALSLKQWNNHPPLTVYRGTKLRSGDFEKIKRNNGSYIAMNSFVSASHNNDVAIAFGGISGSARISRMFPGGREDSLLKPILFEIQIDPQFVSVPFADIADYSLFPDEKEILFALNMVFRIENFSINEAGT